ncbi:MAG: hypothetical protein PHP17_01265 [Candidatus Omnitrophica bacterium]|nr:hypothetical protein [Candidatus Omnitrophota bacterium]
MVYFKHGKEGGRIFKKASNTLLEIIVIIAILGIVYAFTIPSHQKLIEKNKAEAANFNLLSIYNAERRYKLDNQNNQYFSCGGTCNINIINNALSTYINDKNFVYGIVLDGAQGFRATARRVGGNLCNGKVITVTGTNSNVVKGCAVW